MNRYAMIFKVLSEEKRLKVLLLLLKSKGEYYVCEIADALGENHYNVSKYLSELKREEIVKERRVGKGVLYSIKEPDNEFKRYLFKALESIPDEYIKENLELLNLRTRFRKENRCVILKSHEWEKIIEKRGLL